MQLIYFRITASLAILCLLFIGNLHAQKTYPYKSFERDPFHTRVYTLENGLKVYMSVSDKEPRIQTLIAVRTGSKNDPDNATGLAHYLEHMLFKGTDSIATMDPSKEIAIVNRIEALYEEHRKTTDPWKKAKIYQTIDSLSYIASGYAVAGEYDDLVAEIGGIGSNAFTTTDETVYITNIPSNRLKAWTILENERFRNPVLRIFHTELEAVYEEKNMSLDSDEDQAYEQQLAALFPGHGYGTKTTIGTVDHLKNPSMKAIREYYQTWYVPNNMAIILSGDFDPDEAIRQIDATFGKMKPGKIPDYNLKANPIEREITKEITGPEAPFVTVSWRIEPDPGHYPMPYLVKEILSNGQAGLIDLNLVNNQKLSEAGVYYEWLNDYGYMTMYGIPGEGQTLENVKELLLAEVEKLKRGQFPEWMIKAVSNNEDVEFQKISTDYESRAYLLANAFVLNVGWDTIAKFPVAMGAYQKEDVMLFARRNLGDQRVVVYKRDGERKKVDIQKPAITPIQLKKGSSSKFAERLKKIESKPLAPVFADLTKEVKVTEIQPGVQLLSTENKDNNLFELVYYWKHGAQDEPTAAFAATFLEFAGTPTKKSEQIKEEFFRLGTTFSTYGGPDRMMIWLKGTAQNLTKSIEMLEELLRNPVVDPAVLKEVVANQIKQKRDEKKNPSVIMQRALLSYALSGPVNEYTQRLSEEQLKALKPEDVVKYIKGLTALAHKVLYYGPAGSPPYTAQIAALHKHGNKVSTANRNPQIKTIIPTQNQVLYYPFTMNQAEVMIFWVGDSLDPYEYYVSRLYNSYMSSLLFKDLRESKALAYGTTASFQTSHKKERPNFTYAYIGTQSDKLGEAIPALQQNLLSTPVTQEDFQLNQSNTLAEIRSSRTTGMSLIWSWLMREWTGLPMDFQQQAYQTMEKMNQEEFKEFTKLQTVNKNYVMVVMGDPKKIDLKQLEQFGTVKTLTNKELFGE